MNKKDFKKFFEPYSKNVDNANQQSFWKFSDKIIEEIIKIHIPKNLNSENIIMDAGGGTGRWIVNLSRKYKCNFILYDLSEDMLERANENINKAKINSRVKIIHGDLTDIKAVQSNSIDYIVSIYSPISFISDIKSAVNELYRILKRRGKLIIMGHGGFNAINSKINNYLAPATEIKKLEKEFMVKWGTNMPKLHVFSKETMEELLKGSGFKIKNTYGVPVFMQPGPEDFDPENKKISRISKALENSRFFETVFDLEMKYNSLPTIANRGMNILTVAIK